jgi:hypothetical protein
MQATKIIYAISWVHIGDKVSPHARSAHSLSVDTTSSTAKHAPLCSFIQVLHLPLILLKLAAAGSQHACPKPSLSGRLPYTVPQV